MYYDDSVADNRSHVYMLIPPVYPLLPGPFHPLFFFPNFYSAVDAVSNNYKSTNAYKTLINFDCM